MTTWPRDVPPPSFAPRGEREGRPALAIPSLTREQRLRAALVDAAELAAAWKSVAARWLGFAVARGALLLAERDQAQEDAAIAQAHAGDAFHALLVSADQRLDLELRLADVRLRLAAARATLPALERAAAHGGRRDLAAALNPLRDALGGHTRARTRSVRGVKIVARSAGEPGNLGPEVVRPAAGENAVGPQPG